MATFSDDVVSSGAIVNTACFRNPTSGNTSASIKGKAVLYGQANFHVHGSLQHNVGSKTATLVTNEFLSCGACVKTVCSNNPGSDGTITSTKDDVVSSEQVQFLLHGCLQHTSDSKMAKMITDGALSSAAITSDAYSVCPISGNTFASSNNNIVSSGKVGLSLCGSLRYTSGHEAAMFLNDDPLIYHTSTKRDWSKVLPLDTTTAPTIKHEYSNFPVNSSIVNTVLPSRHQGTRSSINLCNPETARAYSLASMPQLPTPYSTLVDAPTDAEALEKAKQIPSAVDLRKRISLPDVVTKASISRCPTPYNSAVSTPTNATFPQDAKSTPFNVDVAGNLNLFDVPTNASVPGCPTPYNTLASTPTDVSFPQDAKGTPFTVDVAENIRLFNATTNASIPGCPTPYNTHASTPTDFSFPQDAKGTPFTVDVAENIRVSNATTNASIPGCPTPYNTHASTPTYFSFPRDAKNTPFTVDVAENITVSNATTNAFIPGYPEAYITLVSTSTGAVPSVDRFKGVKDAPPINEVYVGMRVPNVGPNSSISESPTPYNTVACTPTDAVFPNDSQITNFTNYLCTFSELGEPCQASIPNCPTPYNTMPNTPTEAEFPSDVKAAKPDSSTTENNEVKTTRRRHFHKFIKNDRPVSRNFGSLGYNNPYSDPALVHSLEQTTVGLKSSDSSAFKASWNLLSLLGPASSDTFVPDKKTKLPTTKPYSMDDRSHSVSAQTKYNYLALYFLFNICLTLFNKTLMIAFPYPYLLTSLHAAFGCLGCSVLLKRRYFKLNQQSMRSMLALYAFSVLYTINIVVSNISLHMVTIPFHQVVRATTPAFTVAIYGLLYRKSYSTATYAAMVPIIAGVGLATYGDYSYTTVGLIVTLLGAFLASMKTIAANRLQTGGVHLSAMEILFRMSPLALLQSLVYAHLSGEGAAFYKDVVVPGKMTPWVAVVLALNGLMAFGLNVVSFTANKKVGALTMTVAGNVKQTLTVMLGVAVFGVVVGPVNAIGIGLTILGGALYARAEVRGRGPEAAVAALQGVVVEKL
ncbi:MAG: hypothetical protein M1812_003110 [Candelaria pacifica]|nr:MAG: hypothetical protein M1812_003110 [Candelaria pacifica]